jgi:hypothetical protein
LVPWILYIAAFIWLRRQTPALINEIEHRLAETDHAEGFSYISPKRQAWIVFAGMHRSVEWLLFLAVID